MTGQATKQRKRILDIRKTQKRMEQVRLHQSLQKQERIQRVEARLDELDAEIWWKDGNINGASVQSVHNLKQSISNARESLAIPAQQIRAESVDQRATTQKAEVKSKIAEKLFEHAQLELEKLHESKADAANAIGRAHRKRAF